MTAGTILHGSHGGARGHSHGPGADGHTLHGMIHGSDGSIRGILATGMQAIGIHGTGIHGTGIRGTGIRGIILTITIITLTTGMTTESRDCLQTAGVSMARGSLHREVDLLFPVPEHQGISTIQGHTLPQAATTVLQALPTTGEDRLLAAGLPEAAGQRSSGLQGLREAHLARL